MKSIHVALAELTMERLDVSRHQLGHGVRL